MPFRFITTVALSALLFVSCNSQNASVKNLKSDEFEKGIANDDVLLIDVRTPEEYAEKRILKSQNINVNDAAFEKKMNQLDKSRPLYLYCLAGKRSAKAADWAVKNGFKKVYNLDGGLMAWMDSKKPVEFPSASVTAVNNNGMSFDDYLQHLKESKKLVLVDFNAVWCGPCRILKPVVDKLVTAHAAKVDLFDIDVDKNPDVATNMNVRNIPLLLLYKQGKEVWRNLGVTDEVTLDEKIKQFSD